LGDVDTLYAGRPDRAGQVELAKSASASWASVRSSLWTPLLDLILCVLPIPRVASTPTGQKEGRGAGVDEEFNGGPFRRLSSWRTVGEDVHQFRLEVELVRTVAVLAPTVTPDVAVLWQAVVRTFPPLDEQLPEQGSEPADYAFQIDWITSEAALLNNRFAVYGVSAVLRQHPQARPFTDRDFAPRPPPPEERDRSLVNHQ
jgi:hypothetical protein